MRTWPVLAASLGPQWTATFAGWARDRPPRGALHDGMDLAGELAAAGRLSDEARAELRVRSGSFGPAGRLGIYLQRYLLITSGRWNVRYGGVGAVIVVTIVLAVAVAIALGHGDGARERQRQQRTCASAE